MSVSKILDENLKGTEFVQDATFSLDPIGNRICTRWEDVDKANTQKPFDAVIIGAGMFGGYCAEKLFSRDDSKKLRILVLEAGPFFLPTHVNNLPLGNMSQKPVWGRPWTGLPPFVTDANKDGLAFCVGGRSLFWAGWSPELTPVDLKEWPEDVRKFLNSPDGYDHTSTEIGSKQKTVLIEENATFKKLFAALQKAEGKVFGKGKDKGRIDRIEPAPLAVMAGRPTPGIFPFDQFSSVTFLIDAINQDVNDSKSNLPARRLMLLPRAEVIRLNRSGDAVTSLDLEVRGDEQTLRLGPKTTVVLANGTIEATRLALANLGIGQKARPREVGNFMTHMGNSTTVRIRRKALGLGRPSPSGNDVAAFMVRGEALGRRFHYQVVAAALKKQGGGSPWNFVMRLMPDVDELDRWIGDRDPDWISIVFRGIGEMEGDRRLNPADQWKNSISLKGDTAYVKLGPSDSDNRLLGVMDEVAIELAKYLAGKPENVEYPPKSDHSDIGTTYHEGGTLFMGNVNESITDTYGKFHHLPNVYVAGPALFPTLGSANPSLTGLSLARRTADAILKAHGITPPGPGQPPLVA